MLTTSRRNFIIGASVAALATTTSMKFAFAQERRTLKIGVNGLPATLEPINAISNVGPRIVNQIFDTLIARDFFGNGAPGSRIGLVPALAESWERIDGNSVRFKLRQKVMFHNGVEMTADDVAYTFSSERLWGLTRSRQSRSARPTRSISMNPLSKTSTRWCCVPRLPAT